MKYSPVLIEAAAIFSAALILITALAWNNVANLWFDLYNPFDCPILSRVTYAIVVSVVAIFILAVLEPIRKKDKELGDFWIPQ